MWNTVLYTIFWGSLFLIVYTYILYPIILALWKKSRRCYHNENNSYLPTVSVVISIYNEENVISEKIKNLMSINYPTEKLEILLGSDGSTDRTNEILQSCNSSNFKVKIFKERRGKSAVLNDLVNYANGEIIVFSDANTFFQSDTVKKLVEPFSDKSIGVVCGVLLLQSFDNTIGSVSETWYWKYENIIKQMESDIETAIGATGGVYAIRKNLFQPLSVDKSVNDDFIIPMSIVKQGYRIFYNPEAIAYEKTTGTVSGEFRRKVRIGAKNFISISEFASILHPRYRFIAFALWSHKVIRWFVPFLLLSIFLTSILLSFKSPIYYYILNMQLLFILLGLIGFISEKLDLRIGILGFPYYLIAMNSALFVGFIKFIFGKQEQTWEVIR